MPTKYPEEMKRKVVALANNGKNQTEIPVSYTHLTLPTNREV